MMYNNKCPVCGSKDIKVQSEHYNGLIDSRVIMYCHQCDTEIRTYGKSIQEAVDKFNSIGERK